MKSKTLIGKQLHRKNNQELVDTLLAAKKGDSWIEVVSPLIVNCINELLTKDRYRNARIFRMGQKVNQARPNKSSAGT